MHSLQLCHLDIKPENIAWSPYFNKFIFIDFGLSKYVNGPIGTKSKINFIGTFKYASP
jgi:serine/threonine protein kinase